MKKQSAIRNPASPKGYAVTSPQSGFAKRLPSPLCFAETRRRDKTAIRSAFTTVELLVAISIIALVLTITMPGIIGLFTAGTDLQSRNVISGMLGAARATAIENQSYAGVHVQIGTDGKCWAAVMQYNSTTGKFVPVSGFKPQSMPGDMAFGGISPDYVSGGNYKVEVNTELEEFTTFNIIFCPDGSLTALVNGNTPQLETNVKIFGGDGATPEQKIWDHPADLPPGPTLNEPGVRAMTAFHYKAIKVLPDKQVWLEKNGQFLCVNSYTGKLLPDEQ